MPARTSRTASTAGEMSHAQPKFWLNPLRLAPGPLRDTKVRFKA